MKKFLMVFISLLLGANLVAQQLPNRVDVRATAENQKQQAKLALHASANSVLVNNQKEFVPVQKTTYEEYGWMGSYYYGLNIAGEENLDWAGSQIRLFPDSLAIISAWYYPNSGETSAGHGWAHKTGFTFDPYSYAYDQDFAQPLFGVAGTDGDTMYNYRIDSLIVPMNYQVVDTTGNPDTLRIYISQHDYYAEQINMTTEYRRLTYTSGDYAGVKFLTPAVNYLLPASTQKGSVTKPNAASMISIDYILSTADSSVREMSLTGYKNRRVNLDVPYEVAAGNVVTVLFEFLPGYSYDLDDTLEIIEYNDQTSTFIGRTVKRNYLEIPACNYLSGEEPQFMWLLDQGNGVNSRLMESSDVRYDMDTNYTNYNLHGYYVNNYYAMPIAYMYLSSGSDAIVGIESNNTLTSAIYPNPAQGQLNINLVSNEPASVELFNVLGQKVVSENLNTLSNTLDINGLAAGVYVVKVTQSGKTQTSKVTVK